MHLLTVCPVFLLLLLPALVSARVHSFSLVSTKTGNVLETLPDGAVIELRTPSTIMAFPTRNPPGSDFFEHSSPATVTFTAPFKKVERKAPYALTGDFPTNNLKPLKLGPGKYTVSAFDSDNPADVLTVSFRVVAPSSVPDLGTLTYPPTPLGGTAVLTAPVRNERRGSGFTYQWELTTIALGLGEQEPSPIAGATGRKLSISPARCEKIRGCDRAGCYPLLRYSVKVCGKELCRRSNTIVPNIVAPPGAAGAKKLADEKCSPFGGEVEPFGGFRPSK